MTVFFFWLGLVYVIYLDAKALKRTSAEIYSDIFKFDPRMLAFLSACLSIAALPIYLFHREKYFRILRSTPGIVTSQESYQLSDATGIVIGWLFVISIMTLLVGTADLFFPVFSTRLDEAVAGALLYTGLMLVFIFKVTQRKPYEGFLKSVGFTRAGQPLSKIIFVPVLAGFTLALGISYILLSRSTTPLTPMTEVLDSAKSPWAILSFLGVAILIAPLLEELVFRGYFFAVISKLKGKAFAICSIAIIFTLLHVGQYWGDALAIFIVLLLSFSLTLLRSWSGSTIASTTAHYTYNFFITVIPIGMLIFASPSYFKYQVFYGELDNTAKEVLLKETLQKNPRLTDAYNDLAWLYAQEGQNLDEALTLVERALSDDKDNKAYLDTKAEILYQLGRYAEAMMIEQGVLERDPTNTFFKEQFKKFQEALDKESFAL